MSPYTIPGINMHEFIISQVCEHFKTDPKRLIDKCRKTEVKLPRQIAMYFIRKNLKYSVNKTGLIFLKDHATVTHSEKLIRKWIETDNKFKQMIELIESKL